MRPCGVNQTDVSSLRFQGMNTLKDPQWGTQYSLTTGGEICVQISLDAHGDADSTRMEWIAFL